MGWAVEFDRFSFFTQSGRVNSPSRLSSFSRSLHVLTPAIGLALPSVSEGSAFLKIDSMLGESVDAKHPQWIEVESFSFSGSTQVDLSSGKLSVSKPVLSPITITKRLDRSSGPLFLKCVKGEPASTVTLNVTRTVASGSQGVYYRIILRDVIISGISTEAADDSMPPQERLSLTYSSIEIQYSYMDSKGALVSDTPVTYNQVTGK